jgi:hypothetical protein
MLTEKLTPVKESTPVTLSLSAYLSLMLSQNMQICFTYFKTSSKSFFPQMLSIAVSCSILHYWQSPFSPFSLLLYIFLSSNPFFYSVSSSFLLYVDLYSFLTNMSEPFKVSAGCISPHPHLSLS